MDFSADASTLAWVASKTVDGEWVQAQVISQEDGTATLKCIETGEVHNCSTDVRALPERFMPRMFLLLCHTPMLKCVALLVDSRI